MTDWSRLTHAYGPADDIPGLFARLGGDEGDAELHRADPAELTGIGARLYGMARDAGQDEVAERVTCLFGRATCTECDTVFGVSEQIAAEY